jgi:hypothetical protein
MVLCELLCCYDRVAIVLSWFDYGAPMVQLWCNYGVSAVREIHFDGGEFLRHTSILVGVFMYILLCKCRTTFVVGVFMYILLCKCVRVYSRVYLYVLVYILFDVCLCVEIHFDG